jgi:hypothetical protein
MDTDLPAEMPNPLKVGLLTENSTGLGTVTRSMVRKRAVELALIDGRLSQQVSKSDWEQARRELTGGPELAPKEILLEEATESARWDAVPASEGRKTPVAAGEDEDSEGRSDQERLVEEGIAGAEHDQMVQAARSER